MKKYGRIYRDLDLFHNRVDMENSTVASTDDGLVFQDNNLRIKYMSHMAGACRTTQDKSSRDVLGEREGGTKGPRSENKSKKCGRLVIRMHDLSLTSSSTPFSLSLMLSPE